MQSGGSGVGFSLNEPFWKDDFTECECLLFLEMRCNVIRLFFCFVVFWFFSLPSEAWYYPTYSTRFQRRAQSLSQAFPEIISLQFYSQSFFFKSSVHLSVFLDEMCPFDDPEFELRHVRAETLATCQIARCALLFFAVYSRNVDSRVRFIDRVALKSLMCWLVPQLKWLANKNEEIV